MASKFNRPLLEVSSVEPGRTATIRIPIDPRYHKLALAISATGQVLNQIVERFRLKIGTKVQRDVTPDHLDAIYRLYGQDGDLSYAIQNNVAGQTIQVPIWFAEPWRKSYLAQRAFAWATGGSEPITLEVVIKSDAAADVDIQARAIYDNPLETSGPRAGLPLAMGGIVKWYETDIPVNGTTKTWPDLEKADDLQQITLFDPDIESVQFILGDVTIREYTKEDADADLVGLGMTPDADAFHIVFDDDDDPLSALPLEARKNVYLKLTLSDGTPRNIPAVIQRVGPKD
jgi:hypothetical protein